MTKKTSKSKAPGTYGRPSSSYVFDGLSGDRLSSYSPSSLGKGLYSPIPSPSTYRMDKSGLVDMLEMQRMFSPQNAFGGSDYQPPIIIINYIVGDATKELDKYAPKKEELYKN